VKFVKRKFDEILHWFINLYDRMVYEYNKRNMGALEGKGTKVRAMMRWLQTRGSPKSVVSKAVFGKLKEVQESSTANFHIKY
jgi:hypothetical protein